MRCCGQKEWLPQEIDKAVQAGSKISKECQDSFQTLSTQNCGKGILRCFGMHPQVTLTSFECWHKVVHHQTINTNPITGSQSLVCSPHDNRILAIHQVARLLFEELLVLSKLQREGTANATVQPQPLTQRCGQRRFFKIQFQGG